MRNLKYPNTGVLFKQDRKKSDKAPDWTGTLEIDDELLKAAIVSGAKLRIAGWVRSGRNGEFISLKAEEEKAQGNSGGGGGYGAPRRNDPDVPF